MFLQLLREKEKVLEKWQGRQDYLLQCFDLEKFQSDYNTLDQSLEGVRVRIAEIKVEGGTVELHSKVSFASPQCVVCCGKCSLKCGKRS